jgi:hypothetical protein
MKLSTREYVRRLRKGRTQPSLFSFHQDLSKKFGKLGRGQGRDLDLDQPERTVAPDGFIEILL